MIIKQLIPKEFCHYFTHVLLRHADLQSVEDKQQDIQVPDCLSMLSHELVFETLQERLWGRIENVVERPLIPTYAYARLYQNGNELKKHTDRPACEVSVTLQLGRSHHYAYPIYLEGTRVDLAEGDGILYHGLEQDHWRNKCEGPDGYYSGQAFFHYVYADGDYADEVGDSKKREKYTFRKNRTTAMEVK